MKASTFSAIFALSVSTIYAAAENDRRPETSPSNTAPSRISESAIGESLTLKKLLERHVVGPDGKRLGTVVDVLIETDTPPTSETQFHIAPSAPPAEANETSGGRARNVQRELHSPKQNTDAPRKSGMDRIKVVMSTGGFFGINDRHIVLPLEKIRLSGDDKVVADLTSEEWALLEGAGRYPYSAN